MGGISSEATGDSLRTTAVSAEDLSVDETEDEEPETIKPHAISHSIKDNLLIGTVADLLQEIKTLVQLISE